MYIAYYSLIVTISTSASSTLLLVYACEHCIDITAPRRALLQQLATPSSTCFSVPSIYIVCSNVTDSPCIVDDIVLWLLQMPNSRQEPLTKKPATGFLHSPQTMPSHLGCPSANGSEALRGTKNMGRALSYPSRPLSGTRFSPVQLATLAPTLATSVSIVGHAWRV